MDGAAASAAAVTAAKLVAEKMNRKLNKPSVPLFPGLPQPVPAPLAPADDARSKAQKAAALINSKLGLKSPIVAHIPAVPAALSANETRGAAFGLNRAGFKPAGLTSTEVKVLVGIEVANASSIGFDILAKLKGPSCQNLVHVMKSFPGALISIQGRDSNSCQPVTQ
jgi:hypothetical protein